MKPCSGNRKRIAWLAVDALETRKAAALRDHLARCEGCRRYWEEVSNVTESLTAAAPDSRIEASEAFHRKVSERIEAVESGSVLKNLAAWRRGLMANWRVALPALTVLMIGLLAMVATRHQPSPPEPGPATLQVVSAPSSGTDLAPTLANYRLIASQSLEQLDELLTRQGNKRLPPAPVYTLSSLQLGTASF